MASEKFSSEDAINALKEDGFYCIQDPVMGLRISEMEANGSQFLPSSTAGLEFYRLNVFQDERILSVLKSSFEWCALGDYRRISEDQGHIFQLRKGGAKADILIVQLWSEKSQATHYVGSHKIPPEKLGSVRAANRMWEVARARLEREGSEGRVTPFPNGGLIIMDARVAFETNNGSPITCSYANSHQLRVFRKLTPPNSERSAQLVTSLQSDKVGAHFATDALQERERP